MRSVSAQFLTAVPRFSQRRCHQPTVGHLRVARQPSLRHTLSAVGHVHACVVVRTLFFQPVAAEGFGLTSLASCCEDLAVRTSCG